MPAPVPVSHRGPQRTQCSTNMESRESLVPNWEELWQHHGYYDGYFFSPRLCRTPFGYQTGISGPCTASSHFWAMHSNISLPEVSTYPPSEKVTFSQLHSPTLIMNQQPHLTPHTHTGFPVLFFPHTIFLLQGPTIPLLRFLVSHRWALLPHKTLSCCFWISRGK